MHEIQEKILTLANQKDLGKLSLRKIGALIGGEHPNNVRHHLGQLEKNGFILRDAKHIKPVKRGRATKNGIIAVPVLGLADCGVPGALAQQNFQGFLQISEKLLSKRKEIFAIKAQGDSMNKAKIGTDTHAIEDGDYVLVDGSATNIQNGDYVIAAVDEVAAIKRILMQEGKIILISESTHNYAPIYLHEDDKFVINGKVIQVIKRPRADWLFG